MSIENGSQKMTDTLESKVKINFKIVYNKKSYDISIESVKTVSDLKQEIQSLTSVSPEMQKLIFKGKAVTQSDQTLSQLGIKENDKLLMVGSSLNDVLAINSSPPQNNKQNIGLGLNTAFCKQKRYKKIIDKGVPADAMPAYKNGDEPLPKEGIKGMLNQYEKKCRFAFKLESDQLWVCSDQKTVKYDISSIDSICEEPIEGHEEYYIIQIRMKGRLVLWFYWVPKQYINAIKKAIL